MTNLETTIIEQARHELQNLRRALLMPVGDDRITALASSFWMLSGLTSLGSLAKSGLSEKSVDELLALDKEAGQAIAAAGLVGAITKARPE